MYYHFLFLHKNSFSNFIMFLAFSNFQMFLYFLKYSYSPKMQNHLKKIWQPDTDSFVSPSIFCFSYTDLQKTYCTPMIYNTLIFYSLKTVFQSCEINHVCSAVRVSAYSINIFLNFWFLRNLKTNIFLIFQIFDKIKTYFWFLNFSIFRVFEILFIYV